MLKILKTLGWFLTALAFITLMVVNRDIIIVRFWPLPYEAEIPVFFVFFAGALVGIIGSWLVGVVARIENRLRSRSASDEADEPEELPQALDEIEKQDDSAQ